MDYPAIARGYAEAVATGKIPACRLLKAAAKRYLRMLVLAAKKGNEFYFSPAHVIDHCAMMEQFRHHESGRWEITQIDEDGNLDPHVRMEPWQIWVESAIHGFRVSVTGQRLVTKAVEIEPRKHDKSGRLARNALIELCVGGDMTAQIPLAGNSTTQLKRTIFDAIKKVCKANPEIVEEFGLKVTNEQVTKGVSSIFMLTAQGERQDGLNPSLAIFEEGHSGHKKVYEVVMSAFGAKPNALMRMISTAGHYPEGPAFDLIKRAESILIGHDEDWSFFAGIYTLDQEDYLDPETKAVDWRRLLTDENLLIKANPMYGISLDPRIIKSSLHEAIKVPTKRGEVARTRFNIWTSEGSSQISMAAWMACQADIKLEDFIGKKCWMGLDIADSVDTSAISLIFEVDERRIAVFCRGFLPEQSQTLLDPAFGDQLRVWAEPDNGYLVLTQGASTDDERIEEEIRAYCEVFDVKAIAFDPAHARVIMRHMWEEGKPVVDYRNNAMTMTYPFNKLLGMIANKDIMHDGNPLLAWYATNVYGERRGNGTIVPRKESKNSKRKIDGFAAICMANGVRLTPENSRTGVHETKKPAQDPYAVRGLIGYEERQNA